MLIHSKDIAKELKTLDTTRIHRIAKLCGVQVENQNLLYRWIIANAPNTKVEDTAFRLAYHRDEAKLKIQHRMRDGRTRVQRVFAHAREEKLSGRSPYSKMLIEGNKNIYWASPSYGHSDYNKSIAMENTEKNRAIMNVINRYLGYK